MNESNQDCLANDRVFHSIAALSRLFQRSEDGRVSLRPNTETPPWLVDLLTGLHLGGSPDFFVLSAVWHTCEAFSSEDAKLLRSSSEAIDVYETSLSDAASAFASEHGSSPWKWLMWKERQHWMWLDDVLTLGRPPGDFEGLIAAAMETQARDIAASLVNWLEERMDQETP